MEPTLFNTALFQQPAEPWPAYVFGKKFDACFFVQFPHTRFVEDEHPFYPFDFMNNLSEYRLHVTTPDGTKRLDFDFEPVFVTNFMEPYKAQFANERLLCWHGTGDRWAMVSDIKHGFAVIATDWKIADQVPFFYKDFFLAPQQVAERLGDPSLTAVISQNYAPGKVLTEGSPENPLWVKYHFQGKVESEDDKLFYWKQFGPLQEAITFAIGHFGSRFMWADQAFNRWYNRGGEVYSSGSQAPVGGWQKYSKENCEKVATKFLTQNRHLQLRFEGRNEEADKLYLADKKGVIEFMFFWVYAALEKKRKVDGQMDFYFLLHWYDFGGKLDETNQHFQFCYRKDTIPAAASEQLVENLTKLGFAKKIYHMEQPAVSWKTDGEGKPRMEGIYSAEADLS